MLMCIVNLPERGGGRQSFPVFGHKRPPPSPISINPLPELVEQEFGKCPLTEVGPGREEGFR